MKLTGGILICFLLLGSVVKAQNIDSSYYKAVQILQPQAFTLNKTIGIGSSETSLDIQLPPYTVSWYYSVGTSAVEQPPQMNLFAEILKLFGAGVYTNLVAALTQPSGVKACNVFHFDGNQMTQIGTRKMFSSGVVEIKSPYYLIQRLVFKNPNPSEPLSIQVEAVAVVYDMERVEKERKEREEKTINESITFLGNTINEISAASKKNKEEKKQKERDLISTYMELGGKKIEKGDYDSAIEIFNEAIKEKTAFIYYPYQGLGTAYRYKGDYESSISYYEKAIQLAKEDKNFLARCQSGLGLTYLLSGNELQANKIYIAALNNLSKDENGGIEKSLMIAAINKAIELKGEISGSEDILELLKN